MFEFITITLLYLFVAVKPAQAYLDPGTGSYITQLAIGFLIGGGYFVKMYWQKIIVFFKSILDRKQKNEEKKDS